MPYRSAAARLLAKREPDPVLRRIDTAEFTLGSIAAFVFVVMLTAVSPERLAAVIWTSAIVLLAIVAIARTARAVRRWRIAVRSR